MRSHKLPLILLWAALLLLVACVTPVTEEDLERKLEQTARSMPALGRSRVIPIYADTKTVAWGLLAEARMEPASPLSVQVQRRIEVAARRGFDVVVGGPYPGLSDQIVRNALTLSEGHRLSGLDVVFVSAQLPSPALKQAAGRAGIRLHHRAYP